MQVKEFISTLKKKNFSLAVKEGKLILKGDKDKLSTKEIEDIKSDQEIIGYIKSHKDELIDYISLFPGISVAKNAKDIVSVYRLSGLQQGMLFHGLYENTGNYIEQFGCDIINPDKKILLASWQEVLKRHSILRSAFYYDSFAVPVQCVYKQVDLPVEELDFSDLDKSIQNEKLKEYEALDRNRGFDFKSPPLMRLAFIHLSEDRYRMLWTSHHILFDGWSMPILMGEFLNIYETLISENSLPIIAEDRYEDYIRYLDQQDKAAEEQYWKSYLKGTTHGTLLPFINTKGDRMKSGGKYDTLSAIFEEDFTTRMQDYAKANRITINTLVQGVWAKLLSYYTGNKEILYGVVVSGRPDDLNGVEQRVGMYINTLPLKATVDANQNIITWLQDIQADQVVSRQFQYTSLQDIQQWSGMKKDMFDSLLVFENYPVSKLINSKQWSLKVENIEVNEQTNYPLTVVVASSNKLSVSFNYNSELLSETYITAIKDQFEQVLIQIVHGSSQLLKDVQPLTALQTHQLLKEFNNIQAKYPKDENIISLFEQQVKRTPATTAVIFENETISYQGLNERANQLAHYLRVEGVKAETLVPIFIERSLEMIVGILGILKAGGVYVPVDPYYPADRINYMLKDTDAKLVISTKECRDKLIVNSGVTIIDLDEDREKIALQINTDLEIEINSDQLAYVIYTSGSTGKPKGVLISHYNVVRLFKTDPALYNFNEHDVWTMFHSFCFDFSVWEMYGALLFGGKLVVVPKNATQDFNLFADLLVKEQVTVLNQTPSAFYNLQEVYAERNINKTPIRYVIFGGEALNPAKLQYWNDQYKDSLLINMYGITETTVHVTYQEIRQEQIQVGQSIIGKAIPTLNIYILTPSQELSPIGVSGELYVGGAGLARGYLNLPELTKEKFIKDPFSEEAGARLYKTGDMARWLPDGNIEYLGRIDEQVKIRGYRIEPGEIEAVLQQSGLVSQGVVLAKTDQGGNKRLIGYVVASSNTTFDKEATIRYLKGQLPDYMVPGLWVELESIPLTANGKTDRKALPDPDMGEQANKYVAPRNKTEEQLAAIWQELLHIERVGIHDNFFELGGHSLLAMRLVSAVRRKLEAELSIKEAFTYPTIAQLAAHLTQNSGTVLLPAIPVANPRPEYIPLSFSQERLWFIDKLEGSTPYHLPAVLRLTGTVDTPMLEKALREVINRHEVLRTVIKEHEGKGYQQVMPAENWDLLVTDYSAKYSTENAEELRTYIAHRINEPFALSKDYMLRAELITIAEQAHLLAITQHHIASDGWSISVLVKEVAELYESYTSNKEINLPEPPIQYADYAIWQRSYMQGALLESKLAYWQEKLKNVAPLELPADHARPAMLYTAGATQPFRISKQLNQELTRLSQSEGATLYMTLLSAFKVLLYRYSNQEDICVGTPIAGRQQAEVEGLIGFFINTLALRSRVKATQSYKELLQAVKATTLEAYSHQDVPFEKVVDAVVKARDLGRSPLFQVMFVLQNTPEVPELKLGNLTLQSEVNAHTSSKFDLSLFLTETEEGLQGNIEYRTDLYEAATISRLISHFTELLTSIVANPDERVGQLQLLSEAEATTITEAFSRTAATAISDTDIITTFEAQVKRTPTATAVVFGEESISYAELNNQANQLANYLKNQGIQSETMVPVLLERSTRMIAGILGILKAGGAYVPIDPDYPAERISYMLADTNARLVLTDSKQAGRLKSNATLTIISIDGDKELIAKEPTSNINEKPSAGQLAYVIYTSGSTGKPKGVMVEHKNVVSLVKGAGYVTPDEKDTLLATGSPSFDATTFEYWSMLLNGGKLILCGQETLLNSAKLKTTIETNQVNMMWFTSSWFNHLADSLPELFAGLSTILVGGEKLSEQHIKKIQDKYPYLQLINGYGPTENTTFSLTYPIGQITADTIIPIGRPLNSRTAYILSPEMELSPIGVQGELYLGGAGLSRGYLNQAALTAEKFVISAAITEQARLYKTGDMARWLPDGNIEYLGRIDEQVKIRGYRIEPGEIEAVLQQSELVSQGVVLAKTDQGGNKRLIGYVVASSNTTFDKEATIRYLKGQLPDYMVPGLWVELESIPLTANGKTDRKALPDPDMGEQANKYVAPRNETEEQLAAIWQELLHIERVGIHDNFFELGGHSLLAMRLVSHIEQKLNISIPINVLFKFTSINDLSKYIELKSMAVIEKENNTSFKFLDV